MRMGEKSAKEQHVTWYLKLLLQNNTEREAENQFSNYFSSSRVRMVHLAEKRDEEQGEPMNHLIKNNSFQCATKVPIFYDTCAVTNE